MWSMRRPCSPNRTSCFTFTARPRPGPAARWATSHGLHRAVPEPALLRGGNRAACVTLVALEVGAKLFGACLRQGLQTTGVNQRINRSSFHSRGREFAFRVAERDPGAL